MIRLHSKHFQGYLADTAHYPSWLIFPLSAVLT